MGRQEVLERLGVGERQLTVFLAQGKLHTKPADYDRRFTLYFTDEVEELARELESQRGSGDLRKTSEEHKQPRGAADPKDDRLVA